MIERLPRRASLTLVLTAAILRSLDWAPPIAAAGLAVIADRLASQRSPTLGLELAAVSLALGAAFALDDPAAATVAASPTPLALRNAIRATTTLLLTAPVWLLLTLQSSSPSLSGTTMELAGLITSGLALAMIGMRRCGEGALIAGPGLLALAGLNSALPLRLSQTARWTPVLSAALLIGAAASLDPARRYPIAPTKRTESHRNSARSSRKRRQQRCL